MFDSAKVSQFLTERVKALCLSRLLLPGVGWPYILAKLGAEKIEKKLKGSSCSWYMNQIFRKWISRSWPTISKPHEMLFSLQAAQGTHRTCTPPPVEAVSVGVSSASAWRCPIVIIPNYIILDSKAPPLDWVTIPIWPWVKTLYPWWTSK